MASSLKAAIVKLVEMQASGLKAHSLSQDKSITLFLLFLNLLKRWQRENEFSLGIIFPAVSCC